MRLTPFSMLMIAVALFVAGCQRNATSKASDRATPAVDSQGDTNDPEMKQLDEAVRSNPTRPDPLARRAYARFARGRFDLAFRDYDEAIRLDPTNSALYDARGFAYHMHNRQEEKALADYNEAVRLDPMNHHALNNRAYLLATTLDDRLRNGRKALDDAKKACELTNFSKPGYLDTLAVACAEVGDFERAIQWQKKAMEDPAFEREWGENAREQLRLFRQRKPYRE